MQAQSATYGTFIFFHLKKALYSLRDPRGSLTFQTVTLDKSESC